MMPDEHVVTALETQHRDPDRVSVYLDGAFAFGLSRALAVQYGLHVGRRLSAAEIAALRAVAEEERALQSGLRLLAIRPRSERELRDRLRRKGFTEPAIDAAIERLREWRYVDDAAFARLWIEHRQTANPRSRRVLHRELRKKGVAEETVEDAFAATAVDEEAAALAVARKHLARLARVDPAVRRRRLIAALQRRGFGWDVIRRVVATLEPEESEEDGEDVHEG